MKKSISIIASVGIASAALLSVACGDDGGEGPAPFTGGSNAGTGGAGTGGGTPGGTGGGTPGGTGGGTPGGTGGGGGGMTTPSLFATDGFGKTPNWEGYLFTVPDAAGGTITPDVGIPFVGANLCASGTTAKSYEGFGIIGWNINQPIDPDTMMPVSEDGLPTTVGGSGVKVSVLNNVATTTMRVQIQAADMTAWCAPLPAAGGVIPWTDFRTMCWLPATDTDSVAFDPSTEITQVMVQAVAGPNPADMGATGMATPFDFCIIELDQAP